MNDIEARLQGCFSIVFPALAADQIRAASTQTVAEWNSITTISLANVIEEEFGAIDLEDFAELDSFGSIAEYLTSKTRAAGS